MQLVNNALSPQKNTNIFENIKDATQVPKTLFRLNTSWKQTGIRIAKVGASVPKHPRLVTRFH